MNSHIEIYIHFVWATWNREPLILPEWERSLWSAIRNEVVAQECRLLALGGTEDHVHLLAHLRSTVSVADFVQRVKGSSSLWVNEQITPATHFKWQGSYGAFSVSREDVPQIISYIKSQERHHADGTTLIGYEKTHQPAPRH